MLPHRQTTFATAQAVPQTARPAPGHRPHSFGVFCYVGVVESSRIGKIRVLMFFVGNWRQEHDPRCAFAGIILFRRVGQEFAQFVLELLDPRLAMKRFVETEERQNHARFGFLQPKIPSGDPKFCGRARVFTSSPATARLRITRSNIRMSPGKSKIPASPNVESDRAGYCR